MSSLLKVSVFLLLATAKADTFQGESLEGPHESLRQFIVEHHKETRELLKSEMETFFTDLSESFNHKLQTVELKMETSMLTLSENFNRKLEMSETKILSGLASQSELIRKNHDEVSKPLVDFSHLVNTSETTTMLELHSTVNNQNEGTRKQQQTVVEESRVELVELTADSGTIEFDGEVDSHILRKIWILQASRSTYFSSVGFVMKENNLGANAHLTLWGDYTGSHLWHGSKTDWGKEIKGSGYIILLTLTVKPRASSDNPSSFKMTFNGIRTPSGFAHSNVVSVMKSKGVQSISFPPQNAYDYPRNSFFLAVIAPPTGKPFNLTLKYLDIPCNNSPFYVYFLEESPTGVNYKRQDSSPYGPCGRLGHISELLGTSSAAIVRFWSSYSGGRGFQLETNTN